MEYLIETSLTDEEHTLIEQAMQEYRENPIIGVPLDALLQD
jgi:hypothetical protein